MFVFLCFLFVSVILRFLRMRKGNAHAAASSTRTLLRQTWLSVETCLTANRMRPSHGCRVCSGREDGCREERKEWAAGESED